jgi:hypothetical protein
VFFKYILFYYLFSGMHYGNLPRGSSRTGTVVNAAVAFQLKENARYSVVDK